MKRKALLIGNTHGLQGVQTDLERFATFLRSQKGGAWNSSEIATIENPSKSALLQKIQVLKVEKLDYLVVLFSGHGGHQRQTVLELNGNGETISEKSLQDIATRQLNIYDCCRVTQQEVLKGLAMDSLTERIEASKSDIRERYEARIMQAIPQQVQLYACSIGEYSYDTSDGAVYLGNLLSAARSIPASSNFKLVGDAHVEAKATVSKLKPGQNPDASLPKCLSSQQLVISMR